MGAGSSKNKPQAAVVSVEPGAYVSSEAIINNNHA